VGPLKRTSMKKRKKGGSGDIANKNSATEAAKGKERGDALPVKGKAGEKLHERIFGEKASHPQNWHGGT